MSGGKAVVEPADEQAASIEPNPAGKGVLKLLQEGHFRGVADVRLRVVFNDELTSLSTAAVEEQISAGTEQLRNAVTERVDTLAATEGLEDSTVTAIRELEAAFDSNVEDALAAYTAGTGGDTGEYLDNLQTGFATFYEGLEATLDQSSATTLSMSLLSDLQDTVMSLLDEFAEALTGASEILPALSAPRGNGVAFEKFLREYESLSSLPVTTDQETSPRQLDEMA